MKVLIALLICVGSILAVIYFRLIVPFFYWKKRNVFYVPPWARMKVLWNKKSFAETVMDAYKEFPNLRYYGSYQFLSPSLFVRDVDLIKQITVKDFEHFTDHTGFISEKTDPILGLNLFSLKGRKWREMRSTLSPAFTSSKMKQMFNLIQDTAETFTKHFVEKTTNGDTVTLEMRDVFGKYVNDVIANCAFGIEIDSIKNESNDFYSTGKYVSASFGSLGWRFARTLLFVFFPKIFEFFRIPAMPLYITTFFQTIVKDTIKAREADKVVRPDMIHLLLEARKGRLNHDKIENSLDTGFATVQESELGKSNTKSNSIEITDELITAQALVFFIAAFSTASALMGFLSYELATNPEVLRKLHAEIDQAIANSESGKLSYEEVLKMKYLDQVVSEALRKYPPGFALNRVCTKDYVIPAKRPEETTAIIEVGCVVTVPVIALHYSEEFFPESHRFDPERFAEGNKIVPGSYLPFGSGPRNCIGSRFALLEMKTLLIHLLSQLDLTVVEKTVIPIRWAKSLGLEAKGGVWLGLKRRSL